MSCARVAAAAKRASLAAEASMLRKQQALQHEELRLQQRKQQLALETEIAKVKAEECVLAEAEARSPAAAKNEGFPKCYSTRGPKRIYASLKCLK